jgi:hypothetical protein
MTTEETNTEVEVNPFTERAAQATQAENGKIQKALIPVGPRGVELRDVDAMFRFANCYIQSGLAPNWVKKPQQLVICWAKAAELGLTPLQAVEGMMVVNGQLGIRGDLALAMCESSGKLVDTPEVQYTGEGDELSCTVTVKRKGKKSPRSQSFSIHQAKAAGIYERSTAWKGYPERMVYYRALGFILRDVFPDILKGIKTIEELQDYPDNGGK